MSYKRASMTIEYAHSVFPQYEPSAAEVTIDLEYGEEGKRQMLSDSERLNFFRLARDRLFNLTEKEVIREALYREKQ